MNQRAPWSSKQKMKQIWKCLHTLHYLCLGWHGGRFPLLAHELLILSECYILRPPPPRSIAPPCSLLIRWCLPPFWSPNAEFVSKKLWQCCKVNQPFAKLWQSTASTSQHTISMLFKFYTQKNYSVDSGTRSEPKRTKNLVTRKVFDFLWVQALKITNNYLIAPGRNIQTVCSYDCFSYNYTFNNQR